MTPETDAELWQRCFGTPLGEPLEPPPKPIKRRLTTAQKQARFILDNPELFRPTTESESVDRGPIPE